MPDKSSDFRSGVLLTIVGAVIGVVAALTLQRPVERWLNRREQSAEAVRQSLLSAAAQRNTFTEIGFNNAVEIYAPITAKPGPHQVEALQGLSRTYSEWTALRFRLGLSRGAFPDKAFTYALNASSKAPNDFQTKLAMAYAYQALERYGKERTAAKAKVVELQRDGTVRPVTGFDLRYLDWLSGATDAGKNFPEQLDPSSGANVHMLVDAGMDLVERGRKSVGKERAQYLKRAADLCNQGALIQPGSQVANFCLGYVAMVMDNQLEAIKYYTLAVQGASEFPRAHNNLGFIYAAQKNFVAAAGEFDAAVKTIEAPQASVGIWLDNLGSAYLEAGSDEKACEAWTRSAELPGAGERYGSEWGAAMCDFLHGREDGATEHYQKAIKLASTEGLDLTDIHAFEQVNAGPKELAIARQLIAQTAHP